MPPRSRRTLAEQLPNVASLDVVAEFAQGLSDAKLLCRINNRHIADPRRTKVVPPTRNDRTYVMEGPCIICGQPVQRKFDEDCGRVRTSLAIAYDDDYLMPKGSGRISADGRRILVAEFMRRAVGEPKRARRRASRRGTE